jgi:hypothetical protein
MYTHILYTTHFLHQINIGLWNLVLQLKLYYIPEPNYYLRVWL